MRCFGTIGSGALGGCSFCRCAAGATGRVLLPSPAEGESFCSLTSGARRKLVSSRARGSEALRFAAKAARLRDTGDGAMAAVSVLGGSLLGLARPPSETSSEDGTEEEEAPGVLCSHQVKLGSRAQESGPSSSGQTCLQSHKPPGVHVAQRPPKGPRWARRCGEACRCAGGCCSNNCCMGQRSCSRGSTVHGERHYCWQCFGPERASISVEAQHGLWLHQAPPCYTFSKARRSDKVGPGHSSSVEAQHGPFTFENEKANEDEGQREREVL